MYLTEAIYELRIRRQTGQPFGLLFLDASGRVCKAENCRRRGGPDDRFLYYEDEGRPRQCRKRSLLKVRIDGRWHNVSI